MSLQIIINTDGGLSDCDRAILRAIAGGEVPDTTVTNSAPAEEVVRGVKELAAEMEREVDAPHAETNPPPVNTSAAFTGSAPTPANCPVDEKGVAKNPQFCSDAADPFYKSGPRRGQWKSKRRVPDADYDRWYAGELAKTSPAASDDGDEPGAPVNASAAFAAPGKSAPPAAAGRNPTNVGELIGAISELQVAGNISPQQLDQLYAGVGGVQALFTNPGLVPQVWAAARQMAGV